MTIILPGDYHARKSLESNRIICISEQKAESMDIRALRIGILNIMPEAEAYEFSLLNPLGRSVLQIIPLWIKLRSHQYNSSNRTHLQNLYRYYDDIVKEGNLDGMIITGAPIETLPYEKVHYWDEIKEIILECRKTIPRTLGICWGGLAMAYMLGLEKKIFEKKLFGVFETENLNSSHDITGALDDVFWLPHSRYSGLNDQELEAGAKAGIINLLAHSPETGYSILESADHRYLINLGHFEYEASRIVDEIKRDAELNDVPQPRHFDLSKPTNRWRGQRNEFFAQFVRSCYEQSQKSP